MAFNAQALTLSVDTIAGGAIRIFFYETADASATVLGADYVTSAAKRGLRVGDVLMVYDTNIGEVYVASLDSISAAGHGTLVSHDHLVGPITTSSIILGSSGLNQVIRAAQAAFGTPPAAGGALTEGWSFGRILINDTGVDCSGLASGSQTSNALYGGYQSSGGAKAIGVGVNGTAVVYGAPATASNALNQYIGGSFIGEASANLGGVDTGAGAVGAIFGFGGGAIARAGATNLLNVAGCEVNAGIAVGASSYAFSVFNIATHDSHKVSGVNYDASLSISAINGAIGTKRGVLFSAYNGAHAVAADGKLIATQGAHTVSLGVDFTSYTFTDAAWKSTGATIDGSGNATLKSLILATGASNNVKVAQFAGGTSYNALSLNNDVTNAGMLGLSGGASGDPSLYLKAPTGGGFVFSNAGTAFGTINSLGNLGLSTTAPVAKLHIGGGLASGSDSVYPGHILVESGNVDHAPNGIEFKSSTGGSGYGYRLATIYDAVSAMNFCIQSRQNSANWSNILTIAGATGNVGIGNAAPPIVDGTGRLALSIKGTADAGVLELANGSADADGAATGIIQFSNPNFTPISAAKTRIAVIAVRSEGTTAGDRGGRIEFHTKPDAGDLAEVMCINRNGKVGIGITLPNYTLDVSGVINASGNLRSSGSLIVVGGVDAGTYLAGTGIKCRNGTGGTSIGSQFNIYWNGSAAELWIDNVKAGNITLT